MVKELYLDELSSNVNKTIMLASSQLDNTYLEFLESGIITKGIKDYFNDKFNNSNYSKIYSEIFIFDAGLRIVTHSDSNKVLNATEPRLFLNQNEIFNLEINNSITSLPFKGDDDNWYLWGFYRLSTNQWLAVRESAANFEKVEQLSSIIWYFGLGGILLSIIFGIVVSNSITKPIRELVSFSDHIGKGNLKASPPENMKGELKVLTDALVMMRNNISNNQKEKEKILAQIAHEIRNPLGGIELLTNLISEEESNNQKREEYTKRILNEIAELKKLISSYLDYSKPTKPQPELVNINELVLECKSIFKNDLISNRIIIEEDIQLTEIVFDRVHLKNIIINLLKNSIESISENGEILIESSKINKLSCISIQDNGIGIKSSDIENIFNPFYTTKSDGTGLGLSSCKKYCEDNSAQLRVEQLEKGCKFIICKENTNG
jgi:signal transduction histidine kinase